MKNRESSVPDQQELSWQTHVDILRWRALHQPDLLAYCFLSDGETETDRLTYAQLDVQVRRIAGYLQEINMQGERALLLYPQGLEYVAAFFSCLYAGVVAVPAYPPTSRHSMQRIQVIAADAQATVVLTTTQLLDKLQHSPELFASLQNMRWVTTDALPDTDEGSWHTPAITPADLAFLQYTSGSTAAPKGVMVSYGNLIQNNRAAAAVFNAEGAAFVSWLPLFHDMGLISSMLLAAYCGSPCVLMPPAAFIQKPVRWLQALSHYKGHYSLAPNFAFDLCVQRISQEQRATLDLSGWKFAGCGSEPIHVQTMERFVQTFAECGLSTSSFHACYGLAEATVFVSTDAQETQTHVISAQKHALEHHHVLLADGVEEAVSLVGCGHTWLEDRSIIVDPETLTLCLPDRIGEIWLAGPSVAQGYWNNPEATQETFRAFLQDGSGAGPFLRTGDLGFLQDGRLFITGRRKDTIIIRGRNLYPQDIERTAELAHPALRPGGCAAFSVPVSHEERLVVVQEIGRHHQQWEMQDIFTAVRQAISEEHEITVYAIVFIKAASLPKTSSGKVQRRASKQRFSDEELDVVAQWREPQPEPSLPDEKIISNGLSARQRTAQEIMSWLVALLSQRLGREHQKIDVQAPLAHYGLDSLAIVSITNDLEQWLGRTLSPTLAYEYPSIEMLAFALEQAADPALVVSEPATGSSLPIGVIGMSCRFPGADNLDAFWQLLHDGKDAIGEIPPDRWDVERFYAANPDAPGKMYTRSGGFLRDIRGFDAPFFGISPREAMRMDPQQRLLLEVAWEALEHAGLAVDTLAGSRTGVFIGMLNSSEYGQLQVRSDQSGALDDPYYGIGSSASIASGRLAYLFDLQGPTMTIDTACSSSLVALHLACQSLRNQECDLAVVGGVNSVLTPDSMINACKMHMLAADGLCKTFDTSADGYAMAEGCGVVVLRRLADAQARHEPIQAIIRGSALNQDGRSNGITAPNKLAQKAVIQQALRNAAIDPRRISYVETHGSGTALGDSIELEALAMVLGKERPLEQPVLVGSVKTNIGHTVGAAGIAGFIKTVLALQHHQIPPHRNLHTLTSRVSWQELPLKVPTTLTPWPDGETTRVAGVSSFGWSGTNAHVVLEEAPPLNTVPATHAQHLLLLSAKTAPALDMLSQQLVAYLQSHPEINAPDLAYTSQVGRAALDYRRVLVYRDREDAIAELEKYHTSPRVLTRFCSNRYRPVVFLFPGVGEHYPGMGRELYAQQPFFREIVQEGCRYLHEQHGLDLLPLLQWEAGAIPASRPEQSHAALDVRALLQRGDQPSRQSHSLQATELAHPAVFLFEYALARLLQHWGVVPQALLGYSLGEYVAAAVSGAVSWQEALSVVTQRARLIARLPVGKMLAVLLPEEEARAFLRAGVGLAAITTARTCILAGEPMQIDAIAQELQRQGTVSREVGAEHAFHTAALEPVAQEVAQVLERVGWKEPTIPWISNVTGQWVRGEEMRSPQYWVRQMCETVRWREGVATILERGEQVMIEVGAGQGLGSFVRQHEQCSQEQMGLVMGLVPGEREREGQEQRWWSTLGKVWMAGGQVNWEQGWQAESRRRVVLPTYPFEHQSYWIEGKETSNVSHRSSAASTDAKLDIKDWFYAPTWKCSDAQMLVAPPVEMQPRQQWLVFVDTCEIGVMFSERLRILEQDITTVMSGQQFAQLSQDAYVINPYNNTDYDELFQHLQQAQRMPQHIVHLWNISMEASAVEDIERISATQYHGFYSVLFLAQTLGRFMALQEVQLLVCTNNVHEIVGGDILYPDKATLLGLCTVLTKEYPNLQCRCIDVALTGGAEEERRRIVQCCLAEVNSSLTDKAVAYRAGHRWVPVFEPISLKEVMHHSLSLHEKGVYLITGGLGGLGLHAAEYLAKTIRATLVLIGRTAFPAREKWSQWLIEHSTQDPISKKIHHLQRLEEEYGAVIVVIQADVADGERMQAVIAHVHEQFGHISGVFHLAGSPGRGLLQAKTPEEVEQVFAAKIRGTLILQKLLQAESLDFLLLYSSSVAVLGGLGEGDYAAANAFLDALAHYSAAHSTIPTYSVNWGPWLWDSWQEKIFSEAPSMYTKLRELRENYGITFQEGEVVLPHILAAGLPQLLVLPQGIEKASQQMQALFAYDLSEAPSEQLSSAATHYPRPILHTPYVAPSNELEHKIASVWQACLHLEKVGIHDHFFELGGNSLIAMLVISQMQKNLNTSLSAAVLFEYPTVALLAATFAAQQEASTTYAMQMSSSRGKLRKERIKNLKKHSRNG